MNTKKLFILLSFLFISTMNLKAQISPSYSDAGMWTTFSADFGLNKKTSIIFAEELRIRENYSRLNLFYTNIGLEYALNKYIKTSLVYRPIQKYLDDNTFSNRHRLMWDASVKYKIKKFSFSYRHRLQVEAKNIQSSELGHVPEWYSRNKVEIGYQATKKLAPYFSIEMRYQLADPRLITAYHEWDRVRYQMGVDYKLNGFSKMGVYYLIQKLFNVNSSEYLYITGLEYSISLKDSPLFKKSKKKKK